MCSFGTVKRTHRNSVLLHHHKRSNIRKLIESFPRPTIEPVIGLSTCHLITAVHLKLNANAVFIHSNRGDGKQGYLILTFQPQAHNTLSTTLFAPPINPGLNPVIPEKATGHEISNLCRNHDNLLYSQRLSSF